MKISYSENPNLFTALSAYCINPALPQNVDKVKEEFKRMIGKNLSEEKISKKLEKIMRNAHLGDLQ